MDGSGDQRLAGPALAAEEDGDLGIRNSADDVGDRPEAKHGHARWAASRVGRGTWSADADTSRLVLGHQRLGDVGATLTIPPVEQAWCHATIMPG